MIVERTVMEGPTGIEREIEKTKMPRQCELYTVNTSGTCMCLLFIIPIYCIYTDYLTSQIWLSYVYHIQVEKEGESQWMKVLGLTESDIKALNEGKMLLDTHMFAAHKLIQKQFGLDGCHSTLLCQNRGFSAVYAKGMIWIHYILYCYR